MLQGLGSDANADRELGAKKGRNRRYLQYVPQHSRKETHSPPGACIGTQCRLVGGAPGKYSNVPGSRMSLAVRSSVSKSIRCLFVETQFVDPRLRLPLRWLPTVCAHGSFGTARGAVACDGFIGMGKRTSGRAE